MDSRFDQLVAAGLQRAGSQASRHARTVAYTLLLRLTLLFRDQVVVGVQQELQEMGRSRRLEEEWNSQQTIRPLAHHPHQHCGALPLELDPHGQDLHQGYESHAFALDRASRRRGKSVVDLADGREDWVGEAATPPHRYRHNSHQNMRTVEDCRDWAEEEVGYSPRYRISSGWSNPPGGLEYNRYRYSSHQCLDTVDTAEQQSNSYGRRRYSYSRANLPEFGKREEESGNWVEEGTFPSSRHTRSHRLNNRYQYQSQQYLHITDNKYNKYLD